MLTLRAPDTFFINGTTKPAIFTEIENSISCYINAYILNFIKSCRSIEPLWESIFIAEPHRQEIHTVLLEEFSGISLNLKKYAISMWRL